MSSQGVLLSFKTHEHHTVQHALFHSDRLSTTSRTWPFVALLAISGCPRHSTKTSVGVVARENLRAGRAGSPESPVDRKRLQGDVATFAGRVGHRLRADRSQRPFGKDASVASGLASVADDLEVIARLTRAAHSRKSRGLYGLVLRYANFARQQWLASRAHTYASKRSSWVIFSIKIFMSGHNVRGDAASDVWGGTKGRVDHQLREGTKVYGS